MTDITTKIHELKRQVNLLTRKATSAKVKHTQDKYLAVAAAKRQHLRDLNQLKVLF
ncbi:hypothetical protein [Pontibacter sp. H249]|uniref:hypothetical protein n=1 Tax=Pontibacter sp. H249 TaxID=3133420 RepID=UPI0030C53B4C